MSENRTDNPYAPLALIEEEVKPVAGLGHAHYGLVVVAALPFLYYLIHPLIIAFSDDFVASKEYLQTVQLVLDFPFVVGYIGLFYRKGWAYWLCAIVSGIWVAEMIYILVFAIWHWRDDMMFFLMIWAVFTMWFALIALLAILLRIDLSAAKKPAGVE